MKKYCYLCVFWFFILATGCGYELRKPLPLSAEYDKTYLDLTITSPLYRPLFVELTNSQVHFVDSMEQATAIIRISAIDMRRVIQSIGANNRVQEYRLELTVNFNVEAGDEVLLPKQELNIGRDYIFDIERITGTQQEEEILRKQMYEDISRMIVSNISQNRKVR